jgi:preprotein translocase subunit SecY
VILGWPQSGAAVGRCGYGPRVAQVRNVRPGYAVIHPNRDRMTCKLTRLLVVAILLLSIALMLAVTVGGWSKLQGMTPINFAWCAIDFVLACFILRWARGLLPIAAGVALLLLIIAVISAAGLGGTSWFDRASHGFAAADALGGGAGLSADTIGTLLVILIPVSIALAVVAMIAFTQGWNVEIEVTEAEAQRRGSKPIATGPPATA